MRRPTDRAAALRATAIALASSALLFGVLAWIVVRSPGWPAVREAFFNGRVLRASLPDIVRSFGANVRLFLLAEAIILVLGLLVALLRGLPGAAFFPVRLLMTAYVDVFRTLPGVLVIYILGFGIPGLGLAGLPVDPFFYAVLALSLIYAAYVSEVYRAGIESIDPGQEAAALSLGLSRTQTLRLVILPQALRRVIPPLLNDFIGLQKDTVLVSYIGVVEIFRQSYIQQAGSFNFSPYLGTALVFIVVTLPLARLTDWLLRRDRGRAPGLTA
jgi:polar amino acid transport system permease protein